MKKQGKKQEKNQKKKPEKKPVTEQYLYYMAVKPVTITELYELLMQEELCNGHMELWVQAEVIEITTGEKAGIDIEKAEPFDDEEDVAFLRHHKIERVYSLHVQNESIETVKQIFKPVIGHTGGLLCSDTADFMPVILRKE